jgi:hypothetical protein
MSGFPRDLAVLEPWELSVVRSGELRVWAGGPICDRSSLSGWVEKNRVCLEMSCGTRRALFDRFMALPAGVGFDSPGLGLAFGLSAHPPETDGGGSVCWTRSAFLGSGRALGVGVDEWVSPDAAA